MKTSKRCAGKANKRLGLSFEQMTSICRGCLASERNVFSMTLYEDEFKEMTSVDISPLDGLPQVLCYECAALLQKFFRFKTKVMKSQYILGQYILNGAPIAPDDNFVDLQIQRNVIHFDIPGTEADKLELQIEKFEGGTDIDETKTEDIDFKEELIFDDNETNLCEQDPLNEDIDCQSNDSTLTAFSCDVYYGELAGQDEVPYEFGIEATSTSQSYRDHKYEYTGDTLLRHSLNRQKNAPANKNKERQNSESCTKYEEPHNSKEQYTNGHKYNLDDHNYNKPTIDDTHMYGKPFKCNECSKCFSNKNNLERHTLYFCRGNPKKHIYKPKRKYKCDECDKCFSNKFNLFNHSRAHIDKPYQCDVCSKRYKIKTALILHMSEHFGGKTMCHICGKSVNSLPMHLNRHIYENIYQCDVCKLGFSTKCQLKRHVGEHTGERPFKCPTCLNCFRTNRELIGHVRYVHGENSLTKVVDKTYTCDVCNRRYVSEAAYKTHAAIHKRPYQCDVCSQGFVQKNSLIAHLNAHSAGEKCKCAPCGVTFKSEASYRSHLVNKHPDYKPFKCNDCTEAFPYVDALNRHISKVHCGGKPNKCDVCMKSFKKYSQLTTHSIVHTGERRYKCGLCGRRFISKPWLDVHIRQHTGERPYKCEVCSKGFASKNYLKRHMSLHTGEKRFKCDICLKRFTQKSSLNTHYRRHKLDKTD